MTRELPSPLSLLSKIQRTDAYLYQVAGGSAENLTHDERVTLRSRAFGAGALALVGENMAESGYKNKDGQLFELIGNMQPFVEASRAIAEAHSGHYVRKEHLGEIGKTIDFNHALREVIDHNPKLSPEQLKDFLSAAYGLMYGRSDLAYFEQIADWSLIGMKHEIGFEQIINYIDGLDYTPATKAQELHGVDMVVRYQDHVLGVDIKASRTKVETINQSHQQASSKNSYAIWSQLGAHAFHDEFRIKEATAATKAQAVENDLRAAIQQGYKYVA